MKHRPDRIYLGHTLVAAFSVTLAFLAYTAPTLLERRPNLQVLDGDALMVQKITCSQQGQTVSVTRQALGATEIEVATPEPGGQSNIQIYPGTQAAEDLFAQLMPMPALRALGMVDQDHLTRFGLAPPQATLTLTTDATTHTVLLGQTIYGSGDRYAWVPHQGAYSIHASLVSTLLQGAQRLQDRRLFPMPRTHVAKWVIAQGDALHTLVQSMPSEGLDAWADAAHPDKPTEWLSGFVERLFRLSAAGQQPRTPSDTEQFTITCYAKPELNVAPITVTFFTSGSNTIAQSASAAAPYLMYADPADALKNDVLSVLGKAQPAHD